jgi:hypothetical protein
VLAAFRDVVRYGFRRLDPVPVDVDTALAEALRPAVWRTVEAPDDPSADAWSDSGDRGPDGAPRPADAGTGAASEPVDPVAVVAPADLAPADAPPADALPPRPGA